MISLENIDLGIKDHCLNLEMDAIGIATKRYDDNDKNNHYGNGFKQTHLYMYFQIERERAEHLRPMLQIKENIPATPSDQEEEEEEKPPSIKEESEEEEKYQIPPNMKPTLQPVEDSSRSNSASPLTQDDGEESRLSIVMDEDSSQPVYGPMHREDSNSKMGFGSLKFGKYKFGVLKKFK